MATKDIRDRLYTILSGMTAVTGTYYTVAPRIPKGAADYEGYIILIDLTSATGRRLSREYREELHTWRIRLYSPPLDIGFGGVREDAMYDYRDLILDTLESNQQLEHQTTRAGLTNVSGLVVNNDRLQSPVEWAQQSRALWECSVQITVTRQTTC